MKTSQHWITGNSGRSRLKMKWIGINDPCTMTVINLPYKIEVLTLCSEVQAPVLEHFLININKLNARRFVAMTENSYSSVFQEFPSQTPVRLSVCYDSKSVINIHSRNSHKHNRSVCTSELLPNFYLFHANSGCIQHSGSVCLTWHVVHNNQRIIFRVYVDLLLYLLWGVIIQEPTILEAQMPLKKNVLGVAKLFFDFITVVGNFKYTKSILLGGYHLSQTLTIL